MKKIALLLLISCLLLCSCNLKDDLNIKKEDDSTIGEGTQDSFATDDNQTESNEDDLTSEEGTQDVPASNNSQIDLNADFVNNSKYTIVQTDTGDGLPGNPFTVNHSFFKPESAIPYPDPSAPEKLLKHNFELYYEGSNRNRYSGKVEHWYSNFQRNLHYWVDEDGKIVGAYDGTYGSLVGRNYDENDEGDMKRLVERVSVYLNQYVDMKNYVFREYMPLDEEKGTFFVIFQKKFGDFLTVTSLHVYVDQFGLIGGVRCHDYIDIPSDQKIDFDMEEVENFLYQTIDSQLNSEGRFTSVEKTLRECQLFILEDGTPALRCVVKIACTQPVSELYNLQYTSLEEYVIY